MKLQTACKAAKLVHAASSIIRSSLEIPLAWFPSGVMMGSLCRPKNHARSETVQPFSPTPFARDSLVLRTLHDLSRNKQALSSFKYHIFTKILFTDLLQSLSTSWLKWLVFNQFTATSCSQQIRLEIPTSCTVLFSLLRLDPVTKEEKTKSKIGI